MEAGSLNDTYRTVPMEFQDRGYKTAMVSQIDLQNKGFNQLIKLSDANILK